MRITILSRENCHLCDAAASVIAEVLNDVAAQIPVIEIDVDRHPHLAAAFGNDVPVVLIDDREVFRHRVDSEALASILRGERSPAQNANKRSNAMTLSRETCIPCRGA